MGSEPGVRVRGLVSAGVARETGCASRAWVKVSVSCGRDSREPRARMRMRRSRTRPQRFGHKRTTRPSLTFESGIAQPALWGAGGGCAPCTPGAAVTGRATAGDLGRALSVSRLCRHAGDHEWAGRMRNIGGRHSGAGPAGGAVVTLRHREAEAEPGALCLSSSQHSHLLPQGSLPSAFAVSGLLFLAVPPSCRKTTWNWAPT